MTSLPISISTASLYPADAPQALCCDEVMGALEDVSHKVGQTFGLQGGELRVAGEKLDDSCLPIYLRGLDELLARGGGAYFAGNELSVADLKAFGQTRWPSSGNLDRIPHDLVEREAPGLMSRPWAKYIGIVMRPKKRRHRWRREGASAILLDR
ncbi:MAG: glutathione S-transferase C-terminal domain-containing protein [Gammaproteobacteria bacterium]|nr:glutathione S-transferase C-terminal domain-containing protein [Gammaproteobacteria bacterium]MDH3551376.1 glutathione S-transferase C-terminal domain-containing protein [Gammaproteobacteria bacterium]